MFAPNEDMGSLYVAEVGGLELIGKFNEDANFELLFDGIAYPCPLMLSGPNAFFGNMGLLGADDTGEPFVGLINNSGVLIFAADTAEKHTIGIVSATKKEEKVVHTIDPKFLPPMSNGINIDLDKYGIGSVLLELFAQGGGNTTLESVDGPEHLRNLWDVASDQPDADIILTMRVGVTVLVIRGVTKSFIDTQCTSLVFSTLLSDGGSSYLLNVQIVQLDRGATIILRVS